MPDAACFTGAVLNPNSGEVALNMKQIVEDNSADARRRTSNNGAHDQAWESFRFRVANEAQSISHQAAQDAIVIKHAINAGLILAGQTGTTEGQQTVSPVRTGTGDAIVGTEGVAAAGEAVAAQAVATSLGNLATAMVPIITAAGGVVTAQTLAALLPIVVNAVGGASTPSQTQPKPTA